jgi:hypothetical protein
MFIGTMMVHETSVLTGAQELTLDRLFRCGVPR